MARIQSLKQQRFTETADAPITSTQIMGGSGGIPKMHPLKSSHPIFRASSLMHMMRMKKPKGIKLPRL